MVVQTVANILGKSLAWRIGRALYMYGRDDFGNEIATNGEAALVRAIVATNRDAPLIRFWDVGGNLGDWSAVAVSAAGGTACEYTVDVFEPVPASADHLQQRFAANDSVRLHRLALADAPGRGLFNIVSPTGGTNALLSEGEESINTIEVAIDTGDAVRARNAQNELHLVKIDAEGHDLSILKGLRETLVSGAAQCVQFEYNHRWIVTGSSLHQVFALIADTPYVLAKVNPSSFDILPCWNLEADRFFETNYVLVRKDMVERVGARQCAWDESNVLVPLR